MPSNTSLHLTVSRVVGLGATDALPVLNFTMGMMQGPKCGFQVATAVCRPMSTVRRIVSNDQKVIVGILVGDSNAVWLRMVADQGEVT